MIVEQLNYTDDTDKEKKKKGLIDSYKLVKGKDWDIYTRTESRMNKFKGVSK